MKNWPARSDRLVLPGTAWIGARLCGVANTVGEVSLDARTISKLPPPFRSTRMSACALTCSTMKSVAALLLAAAAAFAASSAVPPSAKWTVAGTSQDTEQVTFSLALPMQNLDQLNTVFNAVSDPDRFVRSSSQTIPLSLH